MASKDPASYIDREYRSLAGREGLVSSIVRVQETDLHILCDRDISERAKELILQCRLQIERYIDSNPGFALALEPIAQDELAPPVIKDMLMAGVAAGVGPMAAVAGTVSQYVGNTLYKEGARDLSVENGGDIYLYRSGESSVAIFAGESPLSYKVGVKVPAEMMPCGVCTSSGTVGHSLSFGVADSVTVVAKSTPLADAAATRLGNEVGAGGQAGLERALKVAGDIPDLAGVVVISGELLGAVGNIELLRID